MSGLSELVNTAWRLLAIDFGAPRTTGPHPDWPAIVETRADEGSGYTWTLASADDQARMMALLAAASEHLHLDVARTEVRTHEWSDDGADVARNALTRTLADLATWPREHISQAAGGHTPPRPTSHPGMTHEDGRPWSHVH